MRQESYGRWAPTGLENAAGHWAWWRGPALAAVLVAALLGADRAGMLPAAPESAVLPLSDWLSATLAWVARTFKPLLRSFSAGLTWPLEAVRALLLWLPWPSVILLAAALGYRARGFRLALGCALALGFVVITGYWPRTAVTLSLLALAVPAAVITGLALGILAYRSPAVARLLAPVLDLMQTVPTLAYLLPILVLFGIGPVVGVVASAVYSIPPMVRATSLGLRRVPPEMVEAGVSAGSTPNQLLAWVLLPAALPTVLVGLNQTIMASLSMVVIASMVAGVDDLGIAVYQTMKLAKFGQSMMAGSVIVIVAVVLDRVSRAFAEPVVRLRAEPGRLWLTVAAAFAVLLLFSELMPILRTFPEALVVRPAPLFDAALNELTRVAFPVTSAVKTWTLYHVLLPLKLGLPASIRPAWWGFSMSPLVTMTYLLAIGAVCAMLMAARRRHAAIAVAAAALFYYLGLVAAPWPVTVAVAALVGWAAGGVRLALLALGTLGFILLTGGWAKAMVSLQLCAAGAGLAFIVGSALGIWAALDRRVAAVVGPLCDMLQTMPVFVFLIPAVMIFLVGEFTALVAIVLYSIAPAIRFAEVGIQRVPAELVEAARMMGVDRWQLLWQVQLPVALPEFALGLNQTVMMALAMVVVASLVGAPGLGQEVMIALSEADSGRGLIAGVNIALLAILLDRLLQAWSAQANQRLGPNRD